MHETEPFPSNQNYFKWAKDHSNLQGRTFDSNISIGVWYKFSTIADTEWANLLQVNNVDSGSGVESRIINLWLNQPWYYLHNSLGVNQPPICGSVVLKDSSFAGNIINRWLYVGISVTVGADSSVYKHCYGIAGGELFW